ncbi:Pycsar system effector family protein [Streptomyces afghaniensis]|uniref:Pycsar system effector family protein n=1 Tax=Streptomyces afghaniensis TaxID=66865 RepID=UPI0037A2975D
MDRSARDVVGADGGQVLRLRAMAADMVVELQRADAKATAVCGAAGGLLTVGVAMLCGVDAPQGLVVAFLLASSLLAAAVGTALWALRPVLPRTGAPGELLGLRRGADAGLLVASFAEMSSARQQHLAEKRLAVMAVLARRKFRAVRLAVDLVVVALAMAGIGLLITYMPR